ncbi:proteasome ATPase [Alloscardovia macacae]|uniref:Proteasome ATPase n=1 Tax=Alloscardovia macacae TaxID=1160091 RepID=A0A1Y2T235_9BIFI|nr:proteasome ATPase [Alloscardovia macacae]OTA26993.1 proteasome ATPase [Alloscardovia macacae]OTA30019.1 proteasome ATPase [Alloscardovia macacae]
MPPENSQPSQNAQDLTAQIDQLRHRNHSLAAALRKATDQLQEARSAMHALSNPPLTTATFVRIYSDSTVQGQRITTLEVIANHRHLVVAASPEVQPMQLRAGQHVLLDENMRVVRTEDFPSLGRVSTVIQALEGSRLLVRDAAGNRSVIRRAHNTLHTHIDPDDTVLVDDSGEYAIQVMESSKAQELLLEEYPDTSFADIGGLDEQIRQIRDAVQLPFTHRELYSFYGLEAAKGILLYGPPGNGKTLLAKAVAHELAADQQGAFLSVKGPEVLSKFVGEAEHMIRMVFERAREIAAEGKPVVIFIDEMDSLLRTRGTGVSSDVETTVVPQFLSELDGLEDLKNVIIIGASNRLDMLDPAVLRPGRLDIKIPIGAPDERAARAILAQYIDARMVEQDDVDSILDTAVHSIYDEMKTIAELTCETGEHLTVRMSELISGAHLKNIVDRAKMTAVKQSLDADTPADTADDADASPHVLLTPEHIRQAVEDEYDEMLSTCAHTTLSGWNLLLELNGRRVRSVRMHDEREEMRA